jgi:hypothetical protein
MDGSAAEKAGVERCLRKREVDGGDGHRQGVEPQAWLPRDGRLSVRQRRLGAAPSRS